ncbi:MAG: phage holin family protein [Bacteroidaceae bacterium]|nr:phage holin family protein [Bacteroidaceae bacterium]
MFDAYLNPELAILSALLYAVGTWIKKSELNDKYIPTILGIIGIILATGYICIMGGFNAKNVFNGIMQGILYAGASVYTNQIVKQAKEE